MPDGATVLIVDDEPDVLAVIGDILGEEAYVVICITHPEDALRMRYDTRPALFFVDLMLPCISGITLARRLREGGFPDTPMIAMSASNSMLASAERSRLFQQTLPKPFDMMQLLRYAEQYAGYR